MKYSPIKPTNKRWARFGRRLEFVRYGRRLSMRTITRTTGLQARTIINLEEGNKFPTAHQLLLLCLALGCSESYALEGDSFEDVKYFTANTETFASPKLKGYRT